MRIDPLTALDAMSRYLLVCDGLERPTGAEAKRVLERTFREHGLPHVIRTDNGPPFAGVGLGSLTPLSAWWVKLGIVPERIEPDEALGQRPPSRLYTHSFRPYPARISSPEYGTGVTVRSVRSTGQIKWRGQMVYVSESLRGEPVGLVQQDERTWTIHFGQLLIGLLDDSTGRVDKVPTKVLPMSPV